MTREKYRTISHLRLKELITVILMMCLLYICSTQERLYGLSMSILEGFKITEELQIL